MLGSSASVATPNTILNTAVAESLSGFCEQLEGVPAEQLDEKIHQILKETISAHKRIIFNGNGYTDEWVEEAEKRGLPNLKSTADALPEFIEPKNLELFTKHHIFTQEEIYSRYEIMMESYSKTIHIEAKTLTEMAEKDFLPALLSYLGDVAGIALQKQTLLPSAASEAEKELVQKLSDSYEEISRLLNILKEDTLEAEGLTDLLKSAQYYHKTILSDMEALRSCIDEAEAMVPDDRLPYPTYNKLLFSV